MFERALKNFVQNDPDISPLISGVHDERRPQDNRGAVQLVFSKIAGGHFADLPGEGACSQPIIQIDAVSDLNTAPSRCRRVLEEIRQKLCGDSAVRGATMGVAPDEYRFVSANTEREVGNFPTPPADGSDNWTFSPSIDIRATVIKL